MELKFRAWDKCLKELINGEGTYGTKLEDMFGYFDIRDNPNRFILMQYIGMNDKNGKEIYESDIVKVANGDIGIVTWKNNDGAMFILKVPKHMINDSWRIHEYQYYSSLIIIGNIYENSELVEDK